MEDKNRLALAPLLYLVSIRKVAAPYVGAAFQPRVGLPSRLESRSCEGYAEKNVFLNDTIQLFRV